MATWRAASPPQDPGSGGGAARGYSARHQIEERGRAQAICQGLRHFAPSVAFPGRIQVAFCTQTKCDHQTHHLRPNPLSPPPSSRPPKRRDPSTPLPDGSPTSLSAHKIINHRASGSFTRSIACLLAWKRDRSPPTVSPSWDAPARAIYTSTEYSLRRRLDRM